MFAIIETNGATHIAIHIPKVGADKTLPAIAAMLEHNAVFIRQSWNEVSTVSASMSIQLGNIYRAEKDGQEIAVAESDAVLNDDFIPAAPEVFASMKKGLARKDEENTRLRNELTATKDQLNALRERISALESETAEQD